MARIENSVVMDAPIADVFRYSMHIPTFTEWWPSLVEARKNKSDQMAVGETWEWTYKMLGMKFDGRAECTELVPNRKAKWKNEGGIPSWFEYTFSEEGGKTRVSSVCEYTIPGKLLGKIADKLIVERMNEREADHVLNNLKMICEAAAKAKTAGAAK